MPKHHIVLTGLSESEFETVVNKKVGDGFVGERGFTPWFRSEFISKWQRVPSDAQNRARETGYAMLGIWAGNIADNLADIRSEHTIRDLVPLTPPSKRAVVVGRGPSLKRKKHAELLREYRDKLTVISTDGALRILAEAGVWPDICVSIDGNRELIKKLYEYDLPESYPRNMKTALGAAVAKNAAEEARKWGELYWFLPMWDDGNLPDSIVRLLTYMTSSEQNRNGAPTLRSGSNSGTCAFTLAFSTLGFKRIGLVGMDMGYPSDFPYEETAYYQNAVKAGVSMETFQQVFTQFRHPVWGNAFCDAVFKQYRKGMLDVISELPTELLPIYNCTEGGTLWGKGIKCLSLKDWLENL